MANPIPGHGLSQQCGSFFISWHYSESPPPNKRQVSRDAKYTRRQVFPVRWYNFIGGRMQVYFEGIYQFNRATYPQTMPKKVDKRSWHNPAKRDTMCSSQTFPAARILLQPAIQTISAPKSVPEFFCSLHKHFQQQRDL